MKEEPNRQPCTRITVLFILVAEASRKSEVSLVNVPFKFRIGSTDLDSGRYSVRLAGNDLLRFTATDGREGTVATVKTGNDSAAGTLVFIEAGPRYLLSKAFWPTGVTAEKDNPSTVESMTVLS